MSAPVPESTFTAELEDVVRRLVTHYRPLKVILFGSHAWGEPHADSDVDLFVIKDSLDDPHARIQAARRMLWDTGGVPFPMDLLVYTPPEVEWRLSLGDPFVRKILEEGVTLHDPPGPRVG